MAEPRTGPLTNLKFLLSRMILTSANNAILHFQQSFWGFWSANNAILHFLKKEEEREHVLRTQVHVDRVTRKVRIERTCLSKTGGLQVLFDFLYHLRIFGIGEIDFSGVHSEHTAEIGTVNVFGRQVEMQMT